MIMKRQLDQILLFSLLTLLISCTSSYQLTIEVMEPAPLTLPSGVNSLIFVNNTVRQPNNVGIDRFIEKQPVENYELDLDSVSWTAIEAMALRIWEAHFFERTSLYKKPLRSDNEWINSLPLYPALKNEIIENQGFDAIISIDKLLLKLDEQVLNHTLKSTSGLSVYADNQLAGSLTYSLYIKEKDAPLISGTLTDSLFYQTSLYADSATIFKELPESLIYHLSYLLGEKLADQILPSWITRDRIIYTGNGARMLEAYSYSKSGKWDTAEILWLNELEKKIKRRDKAKVANNIAVANEMQDRLEDALRWAEKALEYAEENAKEKAILRDYISDLQKRIQNSRLLDNQLRVKN
jgi:tetratricopeptide (TPR) repeat protein